ncbi:homoserine dehydrogenase [Streptoalloteichus tenebrarius]|uniref:Homoserine dehydrogenase n=1 Tax=Streptoalloteichus tenebrarius (strain ATCC 17920 / DSM 40477 / JCM 4838 / CBS 697.72 / NBRC 16177 / NCIMB 11028 / NRRL B-12390 / A12253. 1 / ISP 5477) TaxID=1933 RepID=A0ABT1HXQ1_STRSD|nr:homoserine dehydrogenase [Streptoalloteichus tenebrarius]MCP2260280.1 homoserine dehydrogenase [Streptoalloteichus tenebrarius]BFF03030.1 homoserine dehydrogenase [Streptoalloteichus tenebrarius]
MSERKPDAAPVRVALLGCGTVGTEVVRLLHEQADDLTARVGAPVEVAGVAVRRPNKHRDVPAELLTTDAAGLVDSDVDVVVEVIGGIEPARTLLLAALRSGKSVVTANKALLAEHGAELFEAADASGADLYFEAAVAGAIPLLRPLRESLAGDRITRVMGIVNGTTNFILSAMDGTGASYAETLEEATQLGYAEADPTADVDGFDAAAKAAILASLAFHTRVTAADVHREGIASVTASDVAAARELGRAVKLLAICERVVGEDGSESVSVRVHPAMIPRSHPLAGVNGAFNAVFVEAEAAGQLMFYGQGAGGAPTASAVLGDLVAVARNRVVGGRGPRESAYADLPVRPMGQTPTRYHVSLDVADRSGVLSQVAAVFAEHDVSIAVVRQQGRGEDASLVVVTHSAQDAALRSTVDKIAGLPVVREVVSVMRVEGEEP